MPPSTDTEELVQKVSLYNQKPVLLHGYAGPFIVLYAVWLFMWGSWIQNQPVLAEGDLDVNEGGSLPGTPTDNGTMGEEDVLKRSVPNDGTLEAGFIGLAVIGVLQTLVYLFCHWSVHVRAFLTCTKVKVSQAVWV